MDPLLKSVLAEALAIILLIETEFVKNGPYGSPTLSIKAGVHAHHEA